MELSAEKPSVPIFPTSRFCTHYTAHPSRDEWRCLHACSHVGQWTHTICAYLFFLLMGEKPTFITIHLELIRDGLSTMAFYKLKPTSEYFPKLQGNIGISSLRGGWGLEGWIDIRVKAWASWGMFLCALASSLEKLSYFLWDCKDSMSSHTSSAGKSA